MSRHDEQKSGSILSNVVNTVLKELGISQQMIEKGKELINSVDVEVEGNKKIITLNLKKVTIIIED